MAKISNPIRFSTHFKIDPTVLTAAGVLNPTLNVDTPLFIDPLLLKHSAHPEIASYAVKTYDAHFTTVIALLKGCKVHGDAPWRAASKRMSFPEIKWTCLGYGANSVFGTGSGPSVRTAKEIIDLGVEDPELFAAMALFEEGFGPDSISDMTTNVILADLLDFNARILPGLGVPTANVSIRLANGNTFKAMLPVNPYANSEPIILVPFDILRDLPIGRDWASIAANAAYNAELRDKVNDQIASLWKKKTLRDKSTFKTWALSGRSQFETVLEMINGVNPRPYDIVGDPKGELLWRDLQDIIAARDPLKIAKPAKLDLEGVCGVVETIIGQFRHLIEERRYSEDLYYNDEPKPEAAAQKLFFIVAYNYCKANDLEIIPEAETGRGPVDFKISSGFQGRVLVEIKLSTNNKVVAGFTRQLEAYKSGEETLKGYYVVIDVGGMGKKAENLIKERNAAQARGEKTSPIEFIDGGRKLSASKL
jgi:hypothetical protein